MKKGLCLLLAAWMLLGTVACTQTNAPEETATQGQTSAPQGTETPDDTGVPQESDSVGETAGEDPSDAESTEGGEAATDDSGADETEVSEDYRCDLPEDLDYGQAEVNILYTIASGREDELFVEGSGLGSIEEAVYERNQVVQNQLKITLKLIGEEGDTNVSSKLSTDIKSSSGDYDLIVNGTYVAISSAIGGNYANLGALSNIDTSKHYWTQGYNDLSTFPSSTSQDRQYMASGSVALSMFRLMFFTIYNQRILENNQMEDLYTVVKNGDWTLDYQYNMIAGMYVDSDGDNERSDADTYGFITGNIVSMDPYMVAAGIPMIVKNENGELEYNADAVSSLSELVDKVQKLVNDEGTYVFESSEKDDVGKNYIVEAFINDKSLMATIMFWNMEYHIAELTSMSYGIAPIPKFSKEQSYQSYVQDQVSSFAISAVAKGDRREMLAATLESLAYNSYNIIRPAYYENTLSTKFMQSPESADILEIIFNSLYFDFSQSCSGVVGGTALRDSLRPILSGKTNTVASTTKGWTKSMPKMLKKVNQKLVKLPDD